MSPLLIKISKDFATLFTTINPIATLALFAGLTASLSRADRRWTALRACIYATIILVVAMTVGQVIETRSLPTLTRSYPSSFYLLCR
jgi:multiple antibiotic resistance protein